MDIIIKPHHLLDIFKLHGKGINKFIPDEKFNHDFYLIGNAVIENRVKRIKFTYNYDNICEPCNYLKINYVQINLLITILCMTKTIIMKN